MRETDNETTDVLIRRLESAIDEQISWLKRAHCALLFGDGLIFSAPALPLEEVFDPTGAGDTFAGGFIGYLAKAGEVNFSNMKNAIIYGSALASFCVEKFGTERIKNLTAAEVNDRIQQFVSLSQFAIVG